MFNNKIIKLLIISLICLFGLTALFMNPNNAYAEAINISNEILLQAYLSTGGELKLTNNISVSQNIDINHNASLDLNGHTLSMDSSTLKSYADFTILDSSSAGTGTITTTTASFAIQIGDNANPGALTLNSGTISGTNYGVRNYGTLTINGGTITSPDYPVYNQGETIINGGTILATEGVAFQNHRNTNLIMNGGTIKTEADYQALNLYGDCTATINGGQILAPMHGTHYDGNGVAVFKNTTLTVNGGIISSYSSAIIANGSESGSSESTNAKININGGQIISEADTAIYAPQINGVTTITGGTISGSTGIEIRAGSLEITGGTISGSDNYSVTENTNGTTTTGAAISIAQHITKQPIDVQIKGGNFIANHPISFTNPLNNPEEDIEKIKISIIGGEFTGENYDDVIDNILEGFEHKSINDSIIVKSIEDESEDESEDEPEEESEEDIIPVPNTGANIKSSSDRVDSDIAITVIATTAIIFIVAKRVFARLDTSN